MLKPPTANYRLRTKHRLIAASQVQKERRSQGFPFQRNDSPKGFPFQRNDSPKGFPFQRNDSPKGFTLIELLVVIAIITVLTGMVVLAVASFARRRTLDQAAENLASDILAAKSQSISSTGGRCWGVNFVQGAHARSYTMFATADSAAGCGSYNGRIPASDVLIFLPSGVTVSALSPVWDNQANVVFNRLTGVVTIARNDGWVLGSTLTIELRAAWAGTPKRVRVGAGGVVWVE